MTSENGSALPKRKRTMKRKRILMSKGVYPNPASYCGLFCRLEMEIGSCPLFVSKQTFVRTSGTPA